MQVVCCLIWEILTVTARLASAEERRNIVAIFLKGIKSDFKKCAAHLLGIQCPEAKLVCLSTVSETAESAPGYSATYLMIPDVSFYIPMEV